MPRILIGEPYPEIRELLAYVVTSLGFEPVIAEGADFDSLPRVDALVLEPALTRGVELARRLRQATPDLPIVCVSIYPATPELEALEPAAYLVKPFAISALQSVLRQALRPALAAEPA